jgi:uncharacterized cupredoxin-like copper-binding protein
MKTLFLTLSVICTFLKGIQAQQFEIAPNRLDFNLEPGQWDKMTVNVINHSDKSRNYTVILNDWTIDDEGKVSYFEPGSTEHSCSDWITMMPDSFELAPNETQEITLVMKAPNRENALISKWAMLNVNEIADKFETLRGDKNTIPDVPKNASTGVYIFQSSESDFLPNAKIEKFIKSEEENTINVEIRNIGETIIKGNLALIIKNLQNEEENQPDVKEFTLMPGISGTFTFQFPEHMKKGVYLITGVLDYSDEKNIEKAVLEYEVK